MLHARKDYQERIQDTLPEDQGGIPRDEPVFLLRATDKFATNAILAWIDCMERNNGNPEMIIAVKNLVAAMWKWQVKHGSKTPDMPEGSVNL